MIDLRQKDILHLTLKKKWFELISSGKKKIEYREYKPYWKSRLLRDNQLRKFDEVYFKNGYSKKSPFMRVRCKGIVTFRAGETGLYGPENGEELDGWFFGIILGDILEIRPC